jgi:type I restriction enzyme R subunit
MKNEKLTRKEIIDNRLKQTGWNVIDCTYVIEEFDFNINKNLVQKSLSFYAGHQFSDNVLFGKDDNPLTVVVTKKLTVDANIEKEQAKQCCYNIQKGNDGELPFCFYTNGHNYYFLDLNNYPTIKAFGITIRKDLEKFLQVRKQRKSLTGEFILRHIQAC